MGLGAYSGCYAGSASGQRLSAHGPLLSFGNALAIALYRKVSMLLHRAKRQIVRAFLWRCRVEYCSVPDFQGRWPCLINEGVLRLGRACVFRGDHMRPVIKTLPKATVEFGDECYINQGANICATIAIHVGAHTLLADNVVIMDSHFHSVNPASGRVAAPIVIGRNVWICLNAIVLPGVSIGDHSVIGCNSVVVKDVPAKVVAAGAPARVIRTIDCPDNWIRG